VAAARAAGIAPDIEAAAAQLGDAAADRGQAQAPWIVRLDLAAPRLFRLREPEGVRYLTKQQADAVRFAQEALGVDVLQRSVHVGGIAHSLAKRSGLWAVFAALLTEPGRVMSPDELAHHAWGVGYHAVRHRSRLVVSIKRLRDALGGDVITSAEGGYALSVPRWAVLEPTTGPAEASPAIATQAQDAGQSPALRQKPDLGLDFER
jgi:DNA-binding winged helix-turn-helix (wHTH) protein